MAQRSTNTMVEVLERVLGDLTQSKLALDADLPFILELETRIIDKLRDPVRKMQEQGLLPPGQAPPQQGMGGMGGAPQMGPPPGATPPGVPGLMQGPAAPNADELSRLINSGQ